MVFLLVFMRGKGVNLSPPGRDTGGIKKPLTVWHRRGESRVDDQNPRGAPITADPTTADRLKAPRREGALGPGRFMTLRRGNVSPAVCPPAEGRVGQKTWNCTGGWSSVSVPTTRCCEGGRGLEGRRVFAGDTSASRRVVGVSCCPLLRATGPVAQPALRLGNRRPPIKNPGLATGAERVAA